MTLPALGWLGIVRLGLVQTALGAIVVLTTSTINRVMVVELALPAVIPGALVGLHYAVQVLRPHFGYRSDRGGRLTPWIVAGMAVLATGGTGAAVATAWIASSPLAGLVLAVASFILIGAGVGASGTALLVLLAKRVDPARRAPAATIVWVMMIAGFIVTATTAGHLLDPFTPARLVAVTGSVSVLAFALTLVAVLGVEGPGVAGEAGRAVPTGPAFRIALREVWVEPSARRFTIFVFVSMLAYSTQDLILEPFAGKVFGLTPGASTQLAGLQHAGVLAGMLFVALACARSGVSPRAWAAGGCVASAAALAGLCAAGIAGPPWPLEGTVILLGAANGVFAASAIASMMGLAGRGRSHREGVRMGLWGAAQAVAFGLGGFLGTLAVDAATAATASPTTAYALVFAGEAALFLVAAVLAARVGAPARPQAAQASALLDMGSPT